MTPPSTTPPLAIPAWKRILDLSLTLVSAVLWGPLFLPIALWIKLVSPGPVFFRQERVGLGGRIFNLWKFRTMRTDVETGTHEAHLAELLRKGDAPMTKLDNRGDSRIIPGGRLFRGTGLDELPQLLNVLRGEMSLVGPRPALPFEYERYAPGDKARVDVPPGLTGYWAVNGKNRTTFRQMIEMDLYYAKNLSLVLDLKIMAKTFPALFRQVREIRAAAASSTTKNATNLMEIETETANLETIEL
jgi:lipopolysaccharide/colanic/teichoic acid biosynthesis glycosyltransferase